MATTKYRARPATVKQLMKIRGIDRQRLAEKTELSTKTISLAINGNPMTWEVTSQIAHALDVAPHSFCERIDDDEPVEEVAAP